MYFWSFKQTDVQEGKTGRRDGRVQERTTHTHEHKDGIVHIFTPGLWACAGVSHMLRQLQNQWQR